MDAISVANVFLSKISKDIAQDGHGMNKVKIQKILFFAQEEHLYQYDEPLFEDIIVAWKHGPVVLKVFNHFSSTEMGHNIKYHPQDLDLGLEKFSENQLKTINTIWEKYGDIDTWALVELSHTYKIWKDNLKDTNGSKSIINIESMKQHIKDKKYSKVQAIKEMKQAATSLGF